MLHICASVISLLVLILACVGCALPKMWVVSYDDRKTPNCWSRTNVKTYAGPPVSYGSGATFLEQAPCDASTEEVVGIWKACKKVPALVQDSCRWTPDKPYATAAQKNKNPNLSNKWLIAADKKSGLFPGCSYQRPSDWTCTSISETNDLIQGAKAMADKAGGATLDAWNKANDKINNFKATEGLYVTSIVLHGLGFLVLVVAAARSGSKNLLLAAAGLHALAGLFFMIVGAFMTAKFKDDRTYKNWDGTKNEDLLANWDVTFAAAWTCWLFGWVCAALAAVQSTKVDATKEEATAGQV